MRQYLIGSWANADSYDYSGEQLMGDRLGASRDASHFLKNGQANTEKYGDNTEASTKRKTSIPLTDRILPQAKRVNLLTEQMRELEVEYKSGNMSITDYTLYRDILSVKRSRAEVLLKKAISVRPNTSENNDESEELGVEYATQSDVTEDTCGVAWVDELSSKNTFKKMLQNTCKAFKLAVHYKHKTSSYLQTLKDL